jgi:D-glycerate 3-kinase
MHKEVSLDQGKQASRDIDEVLQAFIKFHDLPQSYAKMALKWFIPLTKKILLHQSDANRPVIVGINGCQGSGKSTLSALLVCLLREHFQKRAISFSIDDFYLSKNNRKQLASSIHPLLETRGVPGTHNTQLLNSCLSALLQGQTTLIPVFDKSIDDLIPQDQWNEIKDAPEIVIFEGWCVGTTAQQDDALIAPVNSLEQALDSSGVWRRYVNQHLANEYQEIFEKIDYQIMLKAPSFEQVYGWRCEQEHRLRKSLTITKNSDSLDNQQNKLMSDEEIRKFIQFYQRLTEHTLTSMPPKCDSLYILNSTRSIEACQHQ